MENLKNIIIDRLLNLTSNDELSKNRLVIVTAAGVITGNPIAVDDDDKIALEFSKFIKELSTLHNDTHGNYFIIKDVQVLDGSVNKNLQFLVVFPEDVIAVTIGSYAPNT